MNHLQFVSLDGHWMAVVYHISGFWFCGSFLFLLGIEQVVL